MRYLIILLLIGVCGCKIIKEDTTPTGEIVKKEYNLDMFKRAWFPKKEDYDIQEIDKEDPFNGAGFVKCARHRDVEKRNKYGYGFIVGYGEAGYSKYVNIQFKEYARSADPFDIEIVNLKKNPPKWFILDMRYYNWFYNKNGERDDPDKHYSYWKKKDGKFLELAG